VITTEAEHGRRMRTACCRVLMDEKHYSRQQRAGLEGTVTANRPVTADRGLPSTFFFVYRNFHAKPIEVHRIIKTKFGNNCASRDCSPLCDVRRRYLALVTTYFSTKAEFCNVANAFIV